MKKKWSAIVAVLMALLVLASTAMPALAQSEKEVNSVEAATKPIVRALGIKAPRVVSPDREFTLTVFQRGTGDPVSDASVWAFSKDEADTLKQQMSEVKVTSEMTIQEQDYESMAKSIGGTWLGTTNNSGELGCTLDETGKYILVAFKKGHYPGFARINVRNIPKALGIRAPRVAPVGEEITMTVYERPVSNISAEVAPVVVEGAGVWVFSRDEAEALKKEMTEVREKLQTAAEDYDYESMMNLHGEFLGWTDGNGQVKHAFNQEGKYVLVTWKKGYWPGFSAMKVMERRTALSIRAPRVAPVGEEITMTVYERPITDVTAEVAPVVVEGAGVWAFSRDGAEALKKEMSEVREKLQTATEEYDYESIMNVHGEFLGRTDKNGQVEHAFNQEGYYILVTWKQGYRPGFAPLKIKEKQTALFIRAPRITQVDKEFTMTVYERPINPISTEAGLVIFGGADVWALSWDKAESLKAEISDMKADADASIAMDSIESRINGLGAIHLGKTDQSGQLSHTFTEEGKYFLVTWKQGYWPGFAPLTVRGEVEALAINAPRTAQVNEKVNVTVLKKHTQTPVAEAGVWALSKDDVKKLRSEVSSTGANADVSAVKKDYESLVSNYGTFLGNTSDSGELVHAFADAGWRLLVTAKQGYRIGFAPILIKAIQTTQILSMDDPAQ